MNLDLVKEAWILQQSGAAQYKNVATGEMWWPFSKQFTIEFKNSVMNFVIRCYRTSGVLSYENHYKNGVVYVFFIFDEDGQRTRTIYFEDGKLIR